MRCAAHHLVNVLARTIAITPYPALLACNIDDVYIIRDVGPRSAADGGTPVGTDPMCPSFGSRTDVLTFLNGKSMVMDADRIPSHPNGFDENINYGQATQCLHGVRMEVQSDSILVSTELATLTNAPRSGDRGSCDRSAASGMDLSFSTTSVLVENVRDNGGCFDITLTYSGFGQEGRAAIARDCKTVSLELFFRDQAVGHRCADGQVGAPTVTLNQESFAGNAVQIYSVVD